MSRAKAPPEKRHRARLLSGVLFHEPRRHRGGVARAALIAGGVLLSLVGVALVVLPVVPGFPLVIIGVLMIAAASAAFRNLLNNLERRLPTAVRARLRRLARKEQETIHRHLDASNADGREGAGDTGVDKTGVGKTGVDKTGVDKAGDAVHR